MWQAKALIRLRVCAGWSEALLVAHTTLLEISCRSSFVIFFESCVIVTKGCVVTELCWDWVALSLRFVFWLDVCCCDWLMCCYWVVLSCNWCLCYEWQSCFCWKLWYEWELCCDRSLPLDWHLCCYWQLLWLTSDLIEICVAIDSWVMIGNNVWIDIWASAWDFQQCGMCDQQRSDQPAHMGSLIRAFACRLNILWVLSFWLNIIWRFYA